MSAQTERPWGKNAQGGMYAYLRDRGRVWVERIMDDKVAHVRFDPADGMRSRVHKVAVADIDFTREWRF